MNSDQIDLKQLATKSDFNELKQEVSVIKTDVSEMKQEFSVMKADVSELKQEVVAIKGVMATKEDLTRMATKEDLTRMATKEDLTKMATKEDLKREISRLEEKMATKDEMQNGFEELALMINKGFDAVMDEIRSIRDDHKVLEMRQDDVDMKMIHKVGDYEFGKLKDRVAVLEEKVV